MNPETNALLVRQHQRELLEEAAAQRLGRVARRPRAPFMTRRSGALAALGARLALRGASREPARKPATRAVTR